MWGSTALAALAVAVVPGAAAETRNLLGFQLDAITPGTWGSAASYFATNVRVAGAILLASWARPKVGRGAPILDVLVFSIVCGNGAAVGVAIGAYGAPIMPCLVHLPLEWSALLLVVAAYLCRGPEPLARTSLVATAAALLLALAAAVEVRVSG